MSEQPLTTRQLEVLLYFIAFRNHHGYPPSLRDVCQEFGFVSPNGAMAHITRLQKKGFIKHDAFGQARTFQATVQFLFPQQLKQQS